MAGAERNLSSVPDAASIATTDRLFGRVGGLLKAVSPLQIVSLFAGVASGLATLGGDSKLTGSQLPALTSSNLSDFAAAVAALAPARSNARQAISGGPISTAGLPTFLPSTNAALSLTSQNVAGGAPFVVNGANGFGAAGPIDRVGIATANLTWSGLTSSRAAATPNFLYVIVNADGTLTTGSTTVAPVYQEGGTPAATAGLFTFNIGEMKGYLGNGTTAPQAYAVFVGEAATDGSGVISSVAYAYNGKYDSGWTATLPYGSIVKKNANLGTPGRSVNFIMECTTTDGGYAVGDVIYNPTSSDGTWMRTIRRGTEGRNIIFIVCHANGFSNTIKGSAWTGFGETAASWKYKLITERGW